MDRKEVEKDMGRKEKPDTGREEELAMGKDRETFLLALLDFLPVAFFGLGMGILGRKLGSPLFLLGAIVCLGAGFMKALWKLILSLTGRDIPFMGKQLRYLMPLGFLLMIVGIFRGDQEVASSLLRGAGRFPSILFFILAGLGIGGMVYCALRLDRMDKRSNWIEQGMNSLAQGFVLLGIWFL